MARVMVWDTASFSQRIALPEDIFHLETIDASGSDSNVIKIGPQSGSAVMIGRDGVQTFISGALTSSFVSGTFFGDGSNLQGISASPNIKNIELSFSGNPYTNYGSWVVSDGQVSITSNIRCWLSAENPTGRDGDEAEMEPMDCFAEDIANGSFTLVAAVRDGPVSGSYVFHYLLG